MPRGDAAQKARQRARNAATTGKSGGSSGIQLLAGSLPRKEWDEIEDIAEHITTFQCVVQSGQMMANRALTMTLVASKEWSPEMLRAVMETHHLATYIQVYVVPISSLMDDDEDTDEEGDTQ